MLSPLRVRLLVSAALITAPLVVQAHKPGADPPGIPQRIPSTDLTPNAATYSLTNSTPVFTASDPTDLRLPEEVLPPPTSQLSTHKDGFFQKLSLTATQIFPDGANGLGMLESQLYGAFALPAPTTDMPLLLIPTFEVAFVDSPSYVSLPSQLYAGYLDFLWMPKLSPRLTGIVSVTPGWYSDFQGNGNDGFRWTGRLVGRYDWRGEQLQAVLGALYLDRHYSRVLPVAGLIWKPNECWSLDLVFPKAKIARRIGWGAGYENWVYLAGGFGGNDWSVQRTGGSPDVLVYRDWRLSLGWEQKRNGGAGFGLEAGYVFYRDLEYLVGGEAYEPNDTLLLRGFLAF